MGKGLRNADRYAYTPAQRRAFGKNVRRHRQAKRLSQEKLAQMVGVHQTAIGVIEKDLCYVTPRQAEAIANALDVPVEDLLNGQ